MNGALLLGIAIVFLSAAYFVYGKYLTRVFGVDPDRKTPAHTRRDGVDYIPTKLPVLFGHHFASIAGAGPIVGPIAAAYFGWGAVVLWVLFGCVFVGAMHDFAALFLSIRNEGRSIGHIIENYLGYSGRQIFLLFCWAALVLVVAVFGVFVAATFVKKPAVASASLLFIAMAPVFGYLVHKKNVPLLIASLIFVPLLFVSVGIGVKFPLDLTVAPFGLTEAWATNVWLIVLAVYVFIASVIPVWVLLQPRDYLNSYLLYAMLLVGIAGIFVASPTLKAPAFEGLVVMKSGSPMYLFPILFVTVACGACSGFHALVASGTTAKQLDSERHILPVGYGSMLVEGLLALMALVSVAYLSKADMAAVMASNTPVVAFAKGLAHFCETLHIPFKHGEAFFALAISAFLLTTLDTATRLTRFTWQELFLPRQVEDSEIEHAHGVFSNRFTATAIVLVAAGMLAKMEGTGPNGDPIPAWLIIWPVFGASNQLLAALTLLIVTVILMAKKSNFWIALIPMVFMMVVCLTALHHLFFTNAASPVINWPLLVAIAFLIIMSIILVVQAGFSIVKHRSQRLKGDQ